MMSHYIFENCIINTDVGIRLVRNGQNLTEMNQKKFGSVRFSVSSVLKNLNFSVLRLVTNF